MMCRIHDSAAVGNLPAWLGDVSHVGGSQTDETFVHSY